jgi:hypothetical protein
MSIASLPSLTLSLHKHKSSTSTSSNNNSNTITNNIVIPSLSDLLSPPTSPRPRRPKSVLPPYEDVELELEDEQPKPDESPKDRVSIDFMKTLIRIQNELLLNNILLINNLKELGDKVIYRKSDLIEMIEILMGVKEIQVNTEEPKKTSCGCSVPLYVKIKSITLGKTIPFLHTEIATRLQEEFKISMEFCIPDM